MVDDTKRPDEQKTNEKKPGPDDYNPVNMAGKKAPVVNTEDKQDAKEDLDHRDVADQTPDHSGGRTGT